MKFVSWAVGAVVGGFLAALMLDLFWASAPGTVEFIAIPLVGLAGAALGESSYRHLRSEQQQPSGP